MNYNIKNFCRFKPLLHSDFEFMQKIGLDTYFIFDILDLYFI